MADLGYVDIVHKESGLTSTVPESTLSAWETAGWTRAENGDEEPDQNLSSTQTLVGPPPPPVDVNEE